MIDRVRSPAIFHLDYHTQVESAKKLLW